MPQGDMFGLPTIPATQMPQELQMILSLAGQDGWAVIEAYAGQRIYVNQSENIFAKLAIPNAAAQALHDYYKGSQFDVPMCTQQLTERRNQKIYQASMDGTSINAIAAEFGIDRRTVFNAINAHKKRFINDDN